MGVIIGIAEAKNGLSELVNRAAYGGERIIVGSRGKPKAAIISLADLQRLEEFESEHAVVRSEQLAVLQRAAALRKEIARDRGGAPLPDSVDDLRRMRNERSQR